jgi:hypothetical protein
MDEMFVIELPANVPNAHSRIASLGVKVLSGYIIKLSHRAQYLDMEYFFFRNAQSVATEQLHIKYVYHFFCEKGSRRKICLLVSFNRA